MAVIQAFLEHVTRAAPKCDFLAVGDQRNAEDNMDNIKPAAHSDRRRIRARAQTALRLTFAGVIPAERSECRNP
jgi:hypothetical protein